MATILLQPIRHSCVRSPIDVVERPSDAWNVLRRVLNAAQFALLPAEIASHECRRADRLTRAGNVKPHPMGEEERS